MSGFGTADRSAFKPVIGGSNMLGSTPNLVLVPYFEYFDLDNWYEVWDRGALDLREVLSLWTAAVSIQELFGQANSV